MRFRLRWARLFPFRRAPRLLEAAPEASTAQIERAAAPGPIVEVKPEPAPVATTIDQVAEVIEEISEESGPPVLPPATIPRALPPPAYPDEWMRARAMYFAPATYSPAPAAERVLAPDLLFRLGAEARRVIAETRSPSQPEPSPAPTPVIAVPEPRLMDDFSTSTETEPQADAAGRVLSVDPLLLTLFFLSREAGPDLPAEATPEYLTEPALLAHAIELRDRVVRQWSAGGAPLGTAAFFQMARQVVPHTGTALLLCHNVAKAFARGGDAIHWQVTNRTRGEYSDGKSSYAAAILHREGTLKTGPFANPSIFFVLFSAADCGSSDPGDYYRFFASAAATWYAATKQVRIPVLPPTNAARHFAQSFVDIARQKKDPAIELTPAYRGWLWAGALSHLDGDAYLRGAAFGLREAGEEPQFQCIATAPHPAESLHFSRAMLTRILEAGSPHIRQYSGGVSFTLLCTVEEGVGCRFSTADWADQSLAALAPAIVDELGWKAVEHSARRQLLLRFTVPGSDAAQAVCQCDRGSGFQPLELS